MASSPCISIITPVFNAKKYLQECVTSVQEQFMQDWELILVDDGSTDGSLVICQALAQSDPRIRVFHQENSGVSSARNFGINKARGEWITFVDADDKIPVDYLPLVFNTSFDLFLTNIKYFPDSIIPMWIEPCIIEEKDYLSFLEKNAHWVVLMSVCSKFIRRRIIIDNGIYFDSRFRLGEDTLFDLQIERYCHSLIVTDSYYLYRHDSDNNWRDKYLYKPEEALCFFSTFIEYYKAVGIQAPKLVSYVFSNISNMTDKSSMSRFQWVSQPPVLEMKSLMKDIMTIKERVKYSISRLFYCLISRKGGMA